MMTLTKQNFIYYLPIKQKKIPKVVRKVGPIAVLRRVQRTWKRIAMTVMMTMADWVSPFRFVQM